MFLGMLHLHSNRQNVGSYVIRHQRLHNLKEESSLPSIGLTLPHVPLCVIKYSVLSYQFYAVGV
jgi:hypothetical protein